MEVGGFYQLPLKHLYNQDEDFFTTSTLFDEDVGFDNFFNICFDVFFGTFIDIVFNTLLLEKKCFL